MAMLKRASVTSFVQRQYSGDTDLRDYWAGSGGPPTHPVQQHGYYGQAQPTSSATVYATDANGNRLQYGAQPAVWNEGVFPMPQGNSNQGFHLQNQVNNNNNYTRAATPFSQNAANVNADSNAGPHQGGFVSADLVQQLFQKLDQTLRTMQQREDEWTFRHKESEAIWAKRYADLEKYVLFLQQKDQRGQHHAQMERGEQQWKQQRQQHRPIGGYRGQQNRGRSYYPPIEPLTKSDDTPLLNEYLDEAERLETARNKNESLAVEGAKVCFVENYGVNILDAPQKVIAHAVAADLWCSKGAAREITREYGRPKAGGRGDLEVGDVLVQEVSEDKTVFHLVTKLQSPDKLYKSPETFLRDVKKSFGKLAEEIEKAELEEIGMTFLCSGIDKMHRLWVMNELYKALKDVKVKVHFYNKYETKRWVDCAQLFRAPDRFEDEQRESAVIVTEDVEDTGEQSGLTGATATSSTDIQADESLGAVDQGSQKTKPKGQVTNGQLPLDRSDVKRNCGAPIRINV